MATEYQVISTQQYHYTDETNRLIDGFRVFFFIPSFGETLYVLVPSLNPAIVGKAIQKVVDDRKKLSTI